MSKASVSSQSRQVVYLTFDGLLQALGESQVVRPIERLARLGVSYAIVSLERPDDLVQERRLSAMRQRLEAVGISWSFAVYRAEGFRAVRENIGAAWNLLTSACGPTTRLVHARGYHSASLARMLRAKAGIPYLFDARGRWVDERILQGRWFTNPVIQRSARLVERRLYQDAKAVVTLTPSHADDATSGVLARARGKVVSIPTCADYSLFEAAAASRGKDPNEKLRVLVSGSNKPMCHHAESFQVARRILELREDAELVILSSQFGELAQLAQANGVSMARTTALEVSPDDMPAWLARCDWALHLIADAPCNRGMFPTKLAEFFASGIRPLHFGCNSDVQMCVAQAGTGLILDSLEPAELRRGADYVAGAGKGDDELLGRGRERTREHLDLEHGVRCYQRLLEEILTVTP